MSELKQAVENSGLRHREGLKALGRNKKHIEAKDTRAILGSADIDSDLVKAFPNDSRWDYAIGYDPGNLVVHFVEIHEARTNRHAKEVLNKLQWLKRWLKGVQLGSLNPKRFHWAATKKIQIPSGNPTLKQLAEHGVKRPSNTITMD